MSKYKITGIIYIHTGTEREREREADRQTDRQTEFMYISVCVHRRVCVIIYIHIGMNE